MATVLDMVVVTLAIYFEPGALDGFLFYLPVMLGVALRYGLAASVWASLVIGIHVRVGGAAGRARHGSPARELLGIRILYVVGLGLAAGLFARVAIGRATENARLQQRLDEEERERMRRREAELLSQLAREFGTSLDSKDDHGGDRAGGGPAAGRPHLAAAGGARRPGRSGLAAAGAGRSRRAAIPSWRSGCEQHLADASCAWGRASPAAWLPRSRRVAGRAATRRGDG